MGLFIFWVLFAIVVGIIAPSRGRTGIGWFFLAVLISPILALILVLALPPIQPMRAAATAEVPAPIGPRPASLPQPAPARREWTLDESRLPVAGYNFRGIPLDEFEDGSFVLHLPTGAQQFASREALTAFLRSNFKA